MRMAVPENPPGFVVRTEAQKAASDNGYRLKGGIEGGWLRYGSTTAPGSIWIAGASDRGPWLLSIDQHILMKSLLLRSNAHQGKNLPAQLSTTYRQKFYSHSETPDHDDAAP
jgi:hypothetical protein